LFQAAPASGRALPRESVSADIHRDGLPNECVVHHVEVPLLLVHLLGVALSVGSVLILDLRLATVALAAAESTASMSN
jgi:hypothetical protein